MFLICPGPQNSPLEELHLACSQTEEPGGWRRVLGVGSGSHIHRSIHILQTRIQSVVYQGGRQKVSNVAMVSPLSYTLLSNVCPRRGRNSAKLFTCSFSLQDACLVLMGAEFEFQREVDTLYSVSTTLG